MNELINFYWDWHKLKWSVAWILKIKKRERKVFSRTINQTEDPEKQRSVLERRMEKYRTIIERKPLTLDDLVTAVRNDLIQPKAAVWIRNLSSAEKQASRSQQSAVQTRSDSSRWHVESWRKTHRVGHGKHPAISCCHTDLGRRAPKTEHCGHSYVYVTAKMQVLDPASQFCNPKANQPLYSVPQDQRKSWKVKHFKFKPQKIASCPTYLLFQTPVLAIWGHLMWGRGRSTVKTYAALFTCLPPQSRWGHRRRLHRLLHQCGLAFCMQKRSSHHHVIWQRHKLCVAVKKGVERLKAPRKPKGIKWIFSSGFPPWAGFKKECEESAIPCWQSKLRATIAFWQCYVRSRASTADTTGILDDTGDLEPLTPNNSSRL